MFLYTATTDQGIQVSTFHHESGILSAARVVAEANAMFIVGHPTLPVLYAVEAKEQQVSAFRRKNDGSLELISRVHSGGAVPCHLAVSPDGKRLVVANYNGGVALFQINDEGRISEIKDSVKLEGSGPHERRQQGSHPHGVTFAPDGSRVYIADLGTDRIQAIRIDEAGEKLSLDEEATIRITPGSGPRHLEFSPAGRLGVVVNELSNTLSIFPWEREFSGEETSQGEAAEQGGVGSPVETEDYSMLPSTWTGVTWAAEISFHPSGKRCYASNRGEHSIVNFSVDEEQRTLGEPAWILDNGTDPQHHLIDKSGEWLFVAYRTSDEIAVYPLNPNTGEVLGERQHTQIISKPMCVWLVED